jgi:SAM-dependent methyltransferase
VAICGIDVALRSKIHIPARSFEGLTIPHPDKSFDAVMFIDVLHHTVEPLRLISEGVRVCRKCIIIKDHVAEGFAARTVLRFMDWIGNAPHGVALTYNYWSEQRWRHAFVKLGLTVGEYRRDLGLYPRPERWIFERSLHFLVRLNVSD